MSKAKRNKEVLDVSGLRYSLEDMVPRRDEQVGSRSFGKGEFLKPIGAFSIDGSNRRIATPSGRKHGFASTFEPSVYGGDVHSGDQVKTLFRPCVRCQIACGSRGWESVISSIILNSLSLKHDPSLSAFRSCLSQCGVEEIDEAIETVSDVFGAWVVGDSLVRAPEAETISIHMEDAVSHEGTFFLFSALDESVSDQLSEMHSHYIADCVKDSYLNFALAAQDEEVTSNLHNRTTCDLIQSGMYRIEVVFGEDPRNLWRHVPAGPGFCIVVGVQPDSVDILFDTKSDVVPTWGSAEISALALFLVSPRVEAQQQEQQQLQQWSGGVRNSVGAATVEERDVHTPTMLSTVGEEVIECRVCVPTPALTTRSTEVSRRTPLTVFSSKEYLAQTQAQSPPAKRSRQRSSSNLAGTGSMVASISFQNKGGKKDVSVVDRRPDDSLCNVVSNEHYTTIRSERIPLLTSAQDGDDILFLGLRGDHPQQPSNNPTPAVSPSRGMGGRKSTTVIEVEVVKEEPLSHAALLQAEIEVERRNAAEKGRQWKPLKLWIGSQSLQSLCDRYDASPSPIMVEFKCPVKQMYLFHIALCLAFGENSVIQEAVPSIYFAESVSQFLGQQTLTLRRCLEAVEQQGGKVPFFAAQDSLQEVVEIFLKEEESQRISSLSTSEEDTVLGGGTVVLIRSPVQQQRSVRMAVTASTVSPVHAEYTVYPSVSGVVVTGTALIANEELKGKFMDALDSMSKLNTAYC